MEVKPLQKKFLLSATGVALLGVIVVLANVLIGWVPLRWDLTQGGVFSLSAASRKLVRELPDKVLVKAYFSPDLPPPFNTYERYTRDLLSEYRAASRGKIQFEFVVPFPLRDFEQQASRAGLAAGQFEQMGSDQMAIRRAFMGLTFFYRDKVEIIPIVRNPQTFEYEFTSRLAKMIERPKKVIGLSTGHGELEWRSAESPLAKDLESLFSFKPVPLTAGATAPVQADALLVVGPSLKFDDAAQGALDRLFESGMPLGMLLHTKNFQAQRFAVFGADTGLLPWLKQKGIALEERLVLDAQCEAIGLTQNVGGLALTSQMRFPFIPLISRFAPDHPLTRGLTAVGLPFVSRVEKSSVPVEGLTFTSLFETSQRSWLAPASLYNAAPDRIPPPVHGEPEGPFTVAAVVEGETPARRLFVMGTAHFLNAQMPEFSGTGAMLMNLLAYLSNDDTLAGIRVKTDIVRPIKPLKQGTREVLKILAVMTPPILAAILGLFFWQRRQLWRKQTSAAYQKQS